jgi:NhaA family Na+:H+ antiporter
VTRLVLPLFAFSNAGIPIPADLGHTLTHPVTFGVILGLVIGKPLGVTLASWAVVRLGWAELLPRTRWRDVLGVGNLAGIGFTMSIFIATLAFGDEENVSLDDAKLAILIASTLAALGAVATLLQRGGARRRPRGRPAPRRLATTH